jgi:hypothetical protein
MSDLRGDLRFANTTELAHLLALNREDEITAAQLVRLDALLAQRGQLIEAHIQAIQHHQQCAA